MANNLHEMSDAELDNYFSSLSDDELNKLPLNSAIAGVMGQKTAPAAAPIVDKTMGMSGPELAAAGLGQRLMGIPRGLQELGVGLTGSPAEIAAHNKEKSEQRRVDQMLGSNWEANLGGLGADVATGAMLPAKLVPQVIAAAAGAAARPTSGDITGLNIPERLASAGTAAGTTAGVGAVLRGAGKAVGAARGEFTPTGQAAMEQDEAARRLGIQRTIGDLDPTSQVAQFEKSLPGYGGRVAEQARAFSQAAKEVKDIPSKTGRSFEPRELEGEKLRASIVEGGDQLVDEGRKLWQSLDNYVVQNGLPSVKPTNTQTHANKIVSQYTPVNKKGVSQLDKNEVLQRIDEFDPDATQVLLSTQNKGTQLPFDDVHRLQTAVGKALQRAEKDASAPGASMGDRKARTELRALYGNLSKDVDAWAVKDPNAKALLSDAKTFWRDRVVPSTLNNKIYQKASQGLYGMHPRAYSGPEPLYGDVTKMSQQMKDIGPYMPQEGRDLALSLRTLPDMANLLSTGKLPPSGGAVSPLTSMAGMAVGSPFQLIRQGLSHIPGLRSATESTPVKRLNFGRNVFENSPTAPAGPLGRMAWGAAQVPQQELESGSNRLLGLRPRP